MNNMIIANPVAAMVQGAQGADQMRQMGKNRALDLLYAEQGAGIANGDANAVDALAQLDPMAARGINQQQFQNDRALASDARAERGLGMQREGLDMRREEHAVVMKKHIASLSAAEAEKEWNTTKRAISRALGAPNAAAFDAMMDEYDFPQFKGQFEKRHEIAKGFVPLLDQLKLRADEGKVSAKEAQIARLMEDNSIDRATAIGIVDGRFATSRHPVTGNAQIVDKATGQAVQGTGEVPPLPQQPQTGQVAPVQPQPLAATTTMPEGTDFSDATGARGFAAQLGNTISDALGGGLIDKNNERATQAMSNLATRTMVTLADGVAGRPSNFLLEQFQALTVSPNSIWQGEGRTRERINQTRAMIADAVLMNRDVLESDVTPVMKAQASQNIARLSRLLNDYDAAILSFGARGDGEAGNQTKSGVTWEIVQ